MISCQEARNAITILDVECPQCGAIVEVFAKDGVVCTDSVCTVSWVSSCPEISPNILAARIKPSKP